MDKKENLFKEFGQLLDIKIAHVEDDKWKLWIMQRWGTTAYLTKEEVLEKIAEFMERLKQENKVKVCPTCGKKGES